MDIWTIQEPAAPGLRPCAIVELRRYLGPHSERPYEDLPGDLESALATVGSVLLVSVPGFGMISGNTAYDPKRPWQKCNDYRKRPKSYRMASEALADR